MKFLNLARTGLILVVLLASTAVQAVQNGSTLLWEISKDGELRGYLFGTMHLADDRITSLSPEIDDALAKSELFAMELIPDFAGMMKLQSAMRLPDGQKLADVVDAQLAERAVAALGKRGVPAMVAERMKPWAAYTTLSMPSGQQSFEFLDMVLYQRAGQEGLDLNGLETIDEQLDFLTGMSADTQEALLRQVVENEGEIAGSLEKMLQFYLANDLAALRDYSDKEMGDLPDSAVKEFESKGLKQRNNVMVERAQPLLEQGVTFIAVGALHLPYEHGLINQLGEQGYELKPLSVNWTQSE